jgi:hypothetical protein
MASGYTKAQKRAYVRRVRAGETLSAIAAEAGVSTQSVRAWVKRFPAKGPKASANGLHTDPDVAMGVGTPVSTSTPSAPVVTLQGLEAYLDAEVARRVRVELQRVLAFAPDLVAPKDAP